MTNRASCRELAMRSLDQLPPFSPVLNGLMASLAEEDVSFARLAGLIERDTVLSGNVLRLVNSALYGRRGTISSVRAAVAMLGLNRLRNFVLGLSVSRMWARVQTPAGWRMDRFNEHSAAVAVFSDLIVQKADVDYPEGAFVAGLLHDLGQLMVAISLPEEYALIRRACSGRQIPIETLEQEHLEITHSELSAAALARWGLPLAIQKAVLYHHRSSDDPAGHGGGRIPLSRAVEIADLMANDRGYVVHEEDGQFGLPAAEALERLGIASHSDVLVGNFERELEAMRGSLEPRAGLDGQP